MLVSDFITNDEQKILLEDALPMPEHSGSTCQIYMVRHFGKRLLLKMLKPDLAGNPRYVEALHKEFETGYRLSHPNLAQYNSLEQNAGTSPYIVMEYIDGDTLEDVLLRDPHYFDDKEHLQKFYTQLLSCLDYLHTHQVLHLDLKPDNLLITRVSGDLKIIDFGFCYTDSYSQSMGRNNGFSAPEQLSAGGSIDARADIYAAGKLIALAAGTSRFAKRLSKVISRSTQPEASLRYDSAAQMLSDTEQALCPKRGKFIWIVILLLAVVASFSVSTLFQGSEPPASEFEDDNVMLYRVISEEEKTCEVISKSSHISTVPDSYIVNATTRRGRTHFQVVAIADSAFYCDSTVTSLSVAEGVTSVGIMSCMYCENLRHVSLPTTITEIGRDAFSSCHKLEEIILPNGIRRLETTVFVGTAHLCRISLPDSLQSIGADCFVSSGLQEVILPSSLRVLERGVFFDCQHLRRITLPASLQSIGDFCFMRCDSLREVINLNPRPIPITDVFEASDSILSLRTLYVPSASVDAYKSAPYWQSFGRIVPIR